MSKLTSEVMDIHEPSIETKIMKENVITEINASDIRILGEPTEDDNHWWFGATDNSVQIQGINCVTCGNYLESCSMNKIPKKIECECEREWYVKSKYLNYNNCLVDRMKTYEGMDAFVGILNPVEGKERLCEDVVGEIFSYLHPV